MVERKIDKSEFWADYDPFSSLHRWVGGRAK